MGGFQYYMEQDGDAAAVRRLLNKSCFTGNPASQKVIQQRVEERVLALPAGARTAEAVTRVLEDMIEELEYLWSLTTGALY